MVSSCSWQPLIGYFNTFDFELIVQRTENMTVTWTWKSVFGAECGAQVETGDVENWISTLG